MPRFPSVQLVGGPRRLRRAPLVCVLLVALLSASGWTFAQDEELPAGDNAEVAKRASYGMGFSIGSNLKGQRAKLDMKALLGGLQDALAGAKPQFTEEEIQAAMQAFDQQQTAQWRKENEDFLADNGKQKDVKTLPSGLQYKVLTAGAGKKPKATDQVVTHYRGTLIDGNQFDSSYDRKQPATFPVNRVIPGWTEALQLMGVGSKWQLFVPAKLAYGDRPPPGAAIPPGSTLIFEVELLEIK